MTRGFRKNDTTGDSIILDEFELNLRNRTLSKNGEMIELTQVEFQIIEYFFKNPNAALSRTASTLAISSLGENGLVT